MPKVAASPASGGLAGTTALDAPATGLAGTGGADGMLGLPGLVLVAVALAGLLAVLFLPKLEPGDRSLKYTWSPFATYVTAIKEMARSPLLMVALAWGYFYLLAGLGLLIIPEYVTVLDVTDEKAARLLAVLGVSIGVGSVTAGLISGHRIEPRLVPLGALGITVFFVLLGVLPPSFWGVAGLIFGAGFFAGFYIIPLQALLQKLSPDGERGRFLGTANAISFAFLSVASLLYWIIRRSFGDNPQRIFLLSAVLMVVGAAFFLYRIGGLVFAKRPSTG